MTGVGLDSYAAWVQTHDEQAPVAPFEAGLAALFGRVNFWAVMFAPEGDRLGKFVDVSVGELTHMLRRAVRDVAASAGFLAVGAHRRSC